MEWPSFGSGHYFFVNVFAKISHIYREGNKCAIWLANHARVTKSNFVWRQAWPASFYPFFCVLTSRAQVVLIFLSNESAFIFEKKNQKFMLLCQKIEQRLLPLL